MTHADVIRAKHDAVVEAAKKLADTRSTDPDPSLAFFIADEGITITVAALRAAEQAACGECEGEGRMLRLPEHAGATGYEYECPACHGTGRKPDTFRDDGATTPEGCEDERQDEVPGA